MEKPIKDELASRESSMWLSANQYTRLMLPDDSILELKGRDYKIYRETLRDDQCASTFAQRRLSVVSKEWKVDPASESAIDVAAADFVRSNIAKLDWDKINDLMLYSRWYGHAVGECMWAVEGNNVVLQDIKVRDRSRFAYDIDDQVYLQKSNGRFELMPERKFWVIRTGADHDDSPYGLGLAHYCYWPVYFKRNGIRFWLTFAEKFGSPTAAGTVPAGMINNESLRQQCLEALNAIASETAVLIPDGMEIKLLEALRSGSGTYEQIVSGMDHAIAKVVVGQTASSEGTPGRLGNDKLQGDVRGDLIKADADLLCGSFNRTISSWLTEWNFPGADTPKVWRITEDLEDLVQTAERDTKIFSLGFEPTSDYITQTYGVGWAKKSQTAEQQPEIPIQEFAEAAALDAKKLQHRQDQSSIVEAADIFASKYEEIIGDRVQSLLDMAEHTKDFETFKKRLEEMTKEGPPEEARKAIERGNVFAKLLGAFRHQK